MIKKTLIYLLIISCWGGLIFTFLYLPSETALSDKKSLNVFTWGDILAPSVISEFEKKTGIKVNLSFFASNEEMVAKLKATKGVGYDLVIPSDYSVEILVKSGLLQKLDKDKLNFFSRLHPRLTNHFFDPGNQYSVPFSWEVFVFGIDKEFFKEKKIDPSWKTVFDTSVIDYCITMPNDPIQTLALASFYLFGAVDHITNPQLNQITDLLITQKNWITAYADFPNYFLATKNSAVVVSSSSYICRSMRRFPFIGLVIPKEGSFITIENLCIPASSKKANLTYQLMNFLYTQASMKVHFDAYATFPPITDLLDNLRLDPDTQLIIKWLFSKNKLLFTTVLTNQEKIRNAWVEIKTN